MREWLSLALRSGANWHRPGDLPNVFVFHHAQEWIDVADGIDSDTTQIQTMQRASEI